VDSRTNGTPALVTRLVSMTLASEGIDPAMLMAGVPSAEIVRSPSENCANSVTRLSEIYGRRSRPLAIWCGRGDSNPHDIAIASPSSWCVCQFRHFRDEDPRPPEGGSDLLRTYFGCGVAGCGGVGCVVGFVGAAGGATGPGVAGRGAADRAGGGGAGVPVMIDPGPRCPAIASTSANTMNNTARIVVALVSTVAPDLAPNAD
jgi:hypothetical protein